jgi:magnesium-transporting ATPase (P-type)
MSTETEVASIDWHALSAQDALRAADARLEGLSATEVADRLARFGPNALPAARGRSALMRFLSQFHNLLIYVLLGAAIITAALGEWVDAAVILGVVLINAIIGFVQEGRAEAAIASIRRMLSLQATVVRGGQREEVAAEELVPGDIVLLAAGDKVPADLRLIRVRGLRVEESALTGESQPVDKSAEAVAPTAALGDRLGMAFSSTLVVAGTATGVVAETGRRTQIGRITELLEQVEQVTTPLIRKLAKFAQQLTVLILAGAGAIFLFGWLVRAIAPQEMFLVVAGLAVSAIPEGLPAIMTITLAIGVRRMAQRRAIIRQLPAVETLGSVTVICSDKTGTLTRDEMSVARVVLAEGTLAVEGVGYAPRGGFLRAGERLPPEHVAGLRDLALAGLLCNDARVFERDGRWEMQGDPTEAALITLAIKAGLDEAALRAAHPRLDALPFESQQRFMATLHSGRIYVKGALEQVLEFCDHQLTREGREPIDRARWMREMEAAAQDGQRVLALASRDVASGQAALNDADVRPGMTLLGLVGMLDPPREEAIAAVACCRRAGIAVKMITGDHALTAQAIGQRLGLDGQGGAVTGQSLDAMDARELRRAAKEHDVFARVSPEHKLRLVEALQAEGEVVAMTGDGVNDAPALKKADVGVAMGIKGTEAAKEAAAMVIADDNFASIAAAVEEGRTVYDNLKKAVLYILPTNGGEVVAIIVAVLFGMVMPITALQILWINMVTETTLSITLAFEGQEARLMERPPRPPTEPLMSGYLLWRVLFVSALFCAGTLALFLWERERGLSVEVARTAAVNAIVFGEITYLFNSRFFQASSLSWRGITGNKSALLASAILLLVQLAFIYLPGMQRLFDTAPLDAATWGMIVLFGGTVFLAVEIEKALLRRMRPLEAANRTP